MRGQRWTGRRLRGGLLLALWAPLARAQEGAAPEPPAEGVLVLEGEQVLQAADVYAPLVEGPPVVVAPMEPFGSVQPLSLTLSGGVSLGAYQAGMAWALLTYLKQHRASPEPSGDAFTVVQPRVDPYLGQAFSLEAMSGTSAGAGNTLAAAMFWCQGEGRTSLWDNILWHMWATFDMEKLLPRDVSAYKAEDGVLTTAGLEEGLEILRGSIEGGGYVPGCQLPVGFAVTRTTPTEIRLGGSLNVATSRYVVPLLLHVDAAGQLMIDNVRLRQEMLLGQEVVFPAVGRHVSTDEVLETVLASAAIPGVFTPRQLSFCAPAAPGETTAPAPGCPDDLPLLTTDTFVDGGAFDRLPLGLSIALARSNLAPWTPSSPQSMLYLTADPLRVRFPDPGRENGSATSQGLVALASFTTDFFMVARQYELQSLARQGLMDGDREILWEGRRGFPVMGRYVGNFGAFVDGGFREFDYLVGVYDGLLHAASLGYLQRLRMDPTIFPLPRLEKVGSFDCGDPAGTEEPYGAKVLVCSQAHFSAVAHELRLDQDPQAAMVIARLMQWELSQALGEEELARLMPLLPAWPLSAGELSVPGRVSLLLDVVLELERQATEDGRKSHGPTAFAALLSRLAQRGYPFEHPAVGRDPEAWLYGLARRGIDRLEQLERQAGGERSLGQKIAIGAVRAASAALPAQATRPTELARDTRSNPGALIPNYVDVNLLRGGIDIGYESWNFTYHGWVAALNAEPLNWQRSAGIRWQVSTETGWQRTGLNWFSGARAGLFVEGPYYELLPENFELGVRVSSRWLGSRAQLGVELPLWTFDPEPTFDPTFVRGMEVTLGLVDVRGFVKVGRGR